jgi:hypothetical protein
LLPAVALGGRGRYTRGAGNGLQEGGSFLVESFKEGGSDRHPYASVDDKLSTRN